jgi:RNA 3'-terminal phosphate cyclase
MSKAAIAKTIDEIHLTTGITISRGSPAPDGGGEVALTVKWLRGTAKGEVFSAASITSKMRILRRVAALAEMASENKSATSSIGIRQSP